MYVISFSFYTSAIASVLFGCFESAFWGLTTPIVVDLLGLEHLTHGFGIIMFTRGVACLMGPPLGGFLIDKTGVFNRVTQHDEPIQK